MIAALLALGVASGAEPDAVAASTPDKVPWELRAAVGAEVGVGPHGVFDVAGRHGDLVLALETLALSVRWEPSGDHGRAWLGARLEPAAAGLLMNLWEDGRPDPSISYLAFMEGVDGGGVAYLPGGLYVGGQAFAQAWEFFGTPSTTVDVPGARPVLRLEALLGFYRPEVHVWVAAGTDWSWGFQPHVRGQLTTAFPWIVRPRVEIRAGWAEATDLVTRVQLGGLNPYVVPLAGAGWGEFRVEDYAAFRVGVEAGQEKWSAALVGDVDFFDGVWAQGFAALGRYDDRGRWIEASLGWAPWLERPVGVPALAGWVRLGIDWGQGFKPRG